MVKLVYLDGVPASQFSIIFDRNGFTNHQSLLLDMSRKVIFYCAAILLGMHIFSMQAFSQPLSFKGFTLGMSYAAAKQRAAADGWRTDYVYVEMDTDTTGPTPTVAITLKTKMGPYDREPKDSLSKNLALIGCESNGSSCQYLKSLRLEFFDGKLYQIKVESWGTWNKYPSVMMEWGDLAVRCLELKYGKPDKFSEKFINASSDELEYIEPAQYYLAAWNRGGTKKAPASTIEVLYHKRDVDSEDENGLLIYINFIDNAASKAYDRASTEYWKRKNAEEEEARKRPRSGF